MGRRSMSWNWLTWLNRNPLGAGEVLIEMLYSPINPYDLRTMRGASRTATSRYHRRGGRGPRSVSRPRRRKRQGGRPGSLAERLLRLARALG